MLRIHGDGPWLWVPDIIRPSSLVSFENRPDHLYKPSQPPVWEFRGPSYVSPFKAALKSRPRPSPVWAPMEKVTYVFGAPAPNLGSISFPNYMRPQLKSVFIFLMDELGDYEDLDLPHIIVDFLGRSSTGDITVVNSAAVKLLPDRPLHDFAAPLDQSTYSTLQDYIELNRREINPNAEHDRLRFLTLKEYEDEVGPTVFKLETDPGFQLV
jgi:hypothetical protein